MSKAKDAFRTISEVADWLDTPTHVLRFWESKFSQIKPVKGAGGRRYYRPTDMDLLGGIKHLLHEDGMTIKGTQKMLREKGVKHVAGLGLSMTAPAKVSAPSAETSPELPPPVDPAPTAPPQQSALDFDEPSQEVVSAETVPEPADTSETVAETTPFRIDLPLPPEDLPQMSARLLGRAPVGANALHARAAEIAPLLSRLEQLRDRIRAQ
ncbi:MerR family transcriptional regulator [Loktanella agnita]|uniref:MerR family transcriptional regulator n=1 Tax=Loktanella agnita TaxID=287097 RepID=UPI003987F160